MDKWSQRLAKNKTNLMLKNASCKRWDTPKVSLYLPVVQGREALWAHTAEASVVTGLHSDRREVLVTRVHNAEPDHRTELPGPSVWPLALAMAVTVGFISSLFGCVPIACG
jgi:hypothetical protein